MNSNETTSTTSTSTDTPNALPDARLASPDAPLTSLGLSLTEMTDEQVQAWHARLRQHRASFPTLASHLAGPKEEVAKSKKAAEDEKLADLYQ